MSVESILKKLRGEINGKNRDDVINDLEEILSENVEEIYMHDEFFQIPLTNIFSTISKIDFSLIEGEDHIMEILSCMIKNTVSAHIEEKETLMLLQNIDISSLFLSYQNIISLLSLFTNCPFIIKLCELYNEEQQLPVKDYEYELKQKNEEIQKLRETQIQSSKEDLTLSTSSSKNTESLSVDLDKPTKLESNIFMACKKGMLSSVQWLIEKENVDPNIKVKFDNYEKNLAKGNSPIHYAVESGHLPIVQYLIDKKGVDKDSKGWNDRTPLQIACKKGDITIIEYLISKGASLDAKDKDGWTPLHFASQYGKRNIINYLLSRGANKNVKDNQSRRPSDVSYIYEIREMLN